MVEGNLGLGATPPDLPAAGRFDKLTMSGFFIARFFASKYWLMAQLHGQTQVLAGELQGERRVIPGALQQRPDSPWIIRLPELTLTTS
ncbi:MAG: hypothetical protein HYY02_13170 [Chloroflexi bacterium]|nr:hypothetical protein [Chloroflexota bacterium]